MELYQLRTFLAIARTGNLTRAASILLVSAGIGVSLLPAFLVDEAASKGQVVAVRGSGAEIELSFLWRARDEGSPLVRPVVEAVREIWA